MKNNILIFLPARQFNEEEYLIISGIFKKGGFNIFITSDTAWLCEGNSGLKVKADINILNIHENNFTALVLAGGNGARIYWNNNILHSVIKRFFNKKKIVAAICSAPVILAKAGILHGITATCFSEDKMQMINAGIDYKESPVVIRKNIITASDPKASHEFAEAIIAQIQN